MRISDWSSDVCSSDLDPGAPSLDADRGLGERTEGPTAPASDAAALDPRGESAGPTARGRTACATSNAGTRRRANHRDRKSVVKGKSGSQRGAPVGRRVITKQNN